MTVRINKIKELPPLSSSAREVLKIVHDEDAEIGEFSQIIERDPAMLAKIIGLANSAFFGTRSVTVVRRAIIDILGLRTAKNIALGIVLGGIFNPKQCPTFDLPKYWFVSLMTATLSRDIATRLKMSSLDANDAYLSGMLNEIGLMALAYLYPVEMAEVLVDNGSSLFERENNVFGQSHYEISAGFLHEWQLPEIVTNVMLESSQNPTRECSDLCHIIHLAKSLANMIYEETAIDLSEMNLPDIISEQPHLIDLIVEEASGQVETYKEMADLLN
ncbi:MAG: HDOD domain-containing protein [Gammaproteobacteria bacterium]|nr:HDOD domain-containing protein [Gammaproteobacteria bacterium]